MDIVAPIKNAHIRVRFSEATRGHRPPTTDDERAKCPPDHTDIHLCVFVPQDKRTVETQALNAETTSTTETDFSFLTAVSSISDPRALGTKGTNADVREEIREVDNKDSLLAPLDLP